MLRQIQKYQEIGATICRSHPHRYIAIGVFVFWIIWIGALLWPRHITFSYAGKTCFYQPTIAPHLLRSEGSAFRLEASDVLSLGGVPIAAATMCAIPTEPPNGSESKATLSFLNINLKKTYTIHAPSAPTLASGLGTAPVPASKAAILQLSSTDVIYAYKLVSGARKALCTVQDTQLLCDLQKLQLQQGATHDVSLERYFEGKHVGTIARQRVSIIKATSITSTSITQNETVYAKPSHLELTTDKHLQSGTVRLYRLEGTTRQEVKSALTVVGNILRVAWTGELSRQASYEVDVTALSAKDGSMLDGDYTLRFSVSGGPKVTNISVGTYKVPLGATATLTFDQPVADTQDISQVITATGGAKVISKNGNKVVVSFKDVPRCGDVTIKVTDALQSNYLISGGSAWKYTTRTICQTQGSIGTSVRGRAIASYSFGGGPNTVLFTGAIHGNETSTRALLLRWIDELEANPRSIPADKTIVVIPVINPDGFAAGTRTNASNVDLNRNFGTADWKSDITTTSNTPFPGGGGSAALSEPESRALANYIGRVRPQLVLSYHSIGGLLAANQAGDSASRASSYASLSGYRNTTGSSDTFEYGISGTADDYYAEVYGIPSVLVELGSHTDPQFSRNQKAMWAMLK